MTEHVFSYNKNVVARCVELNKEPSQHHHVVQELSKVAPAEENTTTFILANHTTK